MPPIKFGAVREAVREEQQQEENEAVASQWWIIRAPRIANSVRALLVGKPVEDPQALSRPYRFLLLYLLALCASIDPMASTIFYREFYAFHHH